MRIRQAGLKSLAVTFLSVAALLPVHGADKIQFSTSSTAPSLVKPGRKIDDLIEGTAERSSKADVSVMPDAPSAPVLPNKAQLDKMSELLDRKKNWLVPGAMDNPDNSNPFGKKDATSKGLGADMDKKESVMERYMRDGDSKKPDENSMNRAERERERRMKGGLDNDRDRRDGNDRDEDTYDPSRKDQNGLAAFDLAGFLSRVQSGHQPELIKDAEALRGFQPKSDFSPTQDFRSDRDRDQAREREAARSAEFMQMIKPRGGVTLSDPLNMPDRTGREMNPIAPRGYEPLSRNSLSPAASAPRPQDSMFGVASPAAVALPSISSEPAPVLAPPSYRPSQSILIAPPTKRLGD